MTKGLASAPTLLMTVIRLIPAGLLILAPLALNASEGRDSTLADYQRAIANHQAEFGPYDEKLGEMTFSLGQNLQMRGKWQESIAVFRRSMHLNKVNHGVHSLTQEPMLRGIIDGQSALGQIHNVSKSYQQLLRLYTKNHDETDTRMVPILDEISHWHLMAYTKTGGRDAEYYLRVAQQLYARALAITAKAYGENDLRMVNLLKNTALTNYYLGEHYRNYPGSLEGTMGPLESLPRNLSLAEQSYVNRSFYLNGKAALHKMMTILTSNPKASTIDQIEGHMAVGDWMILTRHPKRAVTAYQQAIKLITPIDFNNTLYEALFATPKMLPRRPRRLRSPEDFDPATSNPATHKPSTNNPSAETSTENAKGDARNNEETVTRVTYRPENTVTPESGKSATEQTMGDDGKPQDGDSPKPSPKEPAYVVVTADITKAGKPKQITVGRLETGTANTELDNTDNSDKENKKENNEAARKRAKYTIKHTLFRPAFKKDQVVETKALPIKVLMN